jgi:hypothetical protein
VAGSRTRAPRTDGVIERAAGRHGQQDQVQILVRVALVATAFMTMIMIVIVIVRMMIVLAGGLE